MNIYSMVFRRLQFTNAPQSNQVTATVLDTFSGCFQFHYAQGLQSEKVNICLRQ
ncbi:hypothetical protein PanWU01x14_119020 [Parasponia andersonii]|uniref:Uncharacterized protein n=1 Tax=Parasponia andersonii TaxID=3476 RepID=A0A2P5CVZ5_PARAD|nr:hypothetical protein PanWU01x14_119020 [Parasponia andersonii]